MKLQNEIEGTKLNSKAGFFWSLSRNVSVWFQCWCHNASVWTHHVPQLYVSVMFEFFDEGMVVRREERATPEALRQLPHHGTRDRRPVKRRRPSTWNTEYSPRTEVGPEKKAKKSKIFSNKTTKKSIFKYNFIKKKYIKKKILNNFGL